MSYLAELQQARKERLLRMSQRPAPPPPAPPPAAPRPRPLKLPPGLTRTTTIQQVVAEHFELSRKELLSPQRGRRYVLPRQVAMMLTKRVLNKSLTETGRLFGGRDHTTVLHAVNKIDWLEQHDAAFKAQLAELERKVRVTMEVTDARVPYHVDTVGPQPA